MKARLAHHLLAALLCVTFTAGIHAQLVVTTSVDEDDGDASPDHGTGTSLREAVKYAVSGDTITFTNTLAGATLVLTNGQILVDKDLTIDALAQARGVAIDGNASGRIFEFASGTTNVLEGLTLTNGLATGVNPADLGGAIYVNNSADLTILNSTLSGNSAAQGGGIYSSGGMLTILNSTLSDNGASFGAGLNNFGGTLTLQNSTLSGNSAIFGGGGIYSFGGTLTLLNSTLSSNTAESGGGINSDTLNLENSIVAGNSALSGTDISGTISSSTGTNLTSGDPMLAPLGNYGGPTQTMPPLPGSPAIDAGLSTTNTPVTDQRGYARVIGTLDIGAVESGQAIPGVDYTVVTTAEDFLSEYADSGVSLRSAVAFADNDATITFTNSLSGQTLLLTNGQILVSKNLTIDSSALVEGIAIDGNANGRIFECASGTTNVLESLTLTNGLVTGPFPADAGGAILVNNSASLTVNNSTLSGNTAGDNGGGGIFNNGGTLTLNHSTTSSNTAENNGGGIRNSGGTLTLNHSTLSGNTAFTGGGINTGGGTSTLNDSTLSGNTGYFGGGIYASGGGILTLNNSTLSGNTANFLGGGINTGGGTSTLNNSTLSGNAAGNDGGGIYNVAGTLTVSNSTFSGNTSTNSGGGIFSNTDLASQKTTIINSTFHNNSATVGGGGFYNFDGRSELFHCTFTGNTAPAGEGSGVASVGTGATETVVQDCIIADDTDSDVDLVGTVSTNSFTSLGYNLIGTGDALADFSQPGDQTNAVAQLAPLGDYGGPTQTMPPQAGSLAIDAGLSTTNTPATDQRGFSRVVNGTVDIGAVEAGQAIPGVDYTVVTTTDDFLSEYDDNGVSLRSAVAFATNNSIVTFTNTLSGAMIGLTNGQLTLSVNLTIDASGLPGGVALDGMSSNRVFWCSAGTTNALIGLTIVRGAGDLGAGIRNDGVLTVDQCTVSSNSATAAGGGVFSNSGTTLTVKNSTISGNKNGGIDGSVGATLTVQNCTLSGNTTDDLGGGISALAPGVTVTVENSTISGNTGGAGGGIYTDSSCTVTVRNSTLSGNTATQGGGIWSLQGSTVTVQNSTISGNTATNHGGGIYQAASVVLNLENSIVAGNSAPSGTNISGSIDSSTGMNLTSGTPQLAPLGDYGGPTQTMPPLPGSPAIDAAISTTNTPATDQRGFARVIGTLDIGAVEVNHVVTEQEDSVAGSLREIVGGASPGATITFGPALSGQTLPVTNGHIVIERNLTIDDAALPGGVILDGMSSNRVFWCNGGTTNALIGLTIVGGVADRGAGIYNNGVLTVDQCTVSSNSASLYGGGIYTSGIGSTLIVQDSTLSGNMADRGGGIAGILDGTVTVQNSTLSGNTAVYAGTSADSGSGGGIYARDFGTVTVQHSTISGNTASFLGDGIANISSAVNLENSIVVDIYPPWTGSNSITSGDPMLAPLGNYGGPTQTMPPLPGSPAVDAGLDTGSLPATDQRGFVRVVNGIVDIGAVEGVYNPAGPGALTDVTQLGDGSVQFGFTNYSGMPYSILASTNAALPINTWLNIGAAIEGPPGMFQFTDLDATNFNRRFYSVQGP